jgi:hypothetical protein
MRCRPVRHRAGGGHKDLAGEDDGRREGGRPERYRRSTGASCSGVADSQFVGLAMVGRISPAEEEVSVGVPHDQVALNNEHHSS